MGRVVMHGGEVVMQCGEDGDAGWGDGNAV